MKFDTKKPTQVNGEKVILTSLPGGFRNNAEAEVSGYKLGLDVLKILAQFQKKALNSNEIQKDEVNEVVQQLILAACLVEHFSSQIEKSVLPKIGKSTEKETSSEDLKNIEREASQAKLTMKESLEFFPVAALSAMILSPYKPSNSKQFVRNALFAIQPSQAELVVALEMLTASAHEIKEPLGFLKSKSPEMAAFASELFLRAFTSENASDKNCTLDEFNTMLNLVVECRPSFANAFCEEMMSTNNLGTEIERLVDAAYDKLIDASDRECPQRVFEQSFVARLLNGIKEKTNWTLPLEKVLGYRPQDLIISKSDQKMDKVVSLLTHIFGTKVKKSIEAFSELGKIDPDLASVVAPLIADNIDSPRMTIERESLKRRMEKRYQ